MAKIEDLMRDCLKAMEEGKSVEAADFFTDDGVWITPFGKFVGKEQIKKFLNWQNSQMSWTAPDGHFKMPHLWPLQNTPPK